MSTTTTRRSRRAPYTRTVVRIPEQALNERVLDLSFPLIEGLGPRPAPDAVRDAVELAITFWNANVRASAYWGPPRAKQLSDLQRKMTGKKAALGDTERFELLSKRWCDKGVALDPRLVGDWSLDVGDERELRLSCEMELPEGVEAEVLPPIDKRVAIAGKFLDEVTIRLFRTPGTITSMSFPLQRHRGAIGADGSVTIHTQMPTAVALLAKGVLPSMGGVPVELWVQGKKLDAMVLSEVGCDANQGHNDVAVLVFKAASPTAAR